MKCWLNYTEFTGTINEIGTRWNVEYVVLTVNVEPSLHFAGVDHGRHFNNRMLTTILHKQRIELT